MHLPYGLVESAEQICRIVQICGISCADILNRRLTFSAAVNGNHVIIFKAQLFTPADCLIQCAEDSGIEYVSVLGQNGFPDFTFHSESIKTQSAHFCKMLFFCGGSA